MDFSPLQDDDDDFEEEEHILGLDDLKRLKTKQVGLAIVSVLDTH